MPVTKRQDGIYGYVEIDNPPVNAISKEIRQGLLDAAEWAENLKLERVILSGKGGQFAAGADTSEFDKPAEPPHLPDVLNRIEQSDVAWIAAIEGAALGGGAEIALACRYRIAAPNARIGFPETTLGVVPGAGGTQRLPRLIGTAKALEMITFGKPVHGTAAKAMRLVDHVDEDPKTAAEMLNTEWLGMAVPVGELNVEPSDASLFSQTRQAAAKKMRGQQAPLEAIKLIERAQTASLQDGMAAEREVFLRLRQSLEAKALRHVFFTSRAAAKTPAWITAPPGDAGHIAVIGGGTMGSSIAYALLNAGIKVTLLESSDDGCARASANIERIIEASLKRQLIGQEGAGRRRALLSISQDYGHAQTAGLAIEAAFEDMAVKQQIFQDLQAAMPDHAILATNTSYLDINEIAQILDDPARLLGLHFFAPAHIMKLLEIVRGSETSQKALATGFALAKTLRKIPVLAGVCDGFIGNRILMRYREAADTLLMDGSTPWEIDEAMVEFGYPMGPYEAQDLSGLDIAYANRRRQDATRDPKRRYIPIADRMVQEGRLGRKTGAGWYRYPGGGGKVIDPLIEDLITEEAHFAKVTRHEITNETIRQTLLTAMINEASNILHEGIAQSAKDIDLVTIHGYGFPSHKGGLMHYADSIGAATWLQGLNDLQATDPITWKPSTVIGQCARQGLALAEWKRDG